MHHSFKMSYLEPILVHPVRRQNFAGKSDSTFWNIWDWVIYSWIWDFTVFELNKIPKAPYLHSCQFVFLEVLVLCFCFLRTICVFCVSVFFWWLYFSKCRCKENCNAVAICVFVFCVSVFSWSWYFLNCRCKENCIAVAICGSTSATEAWLKQRNYFRKVVVRTNFQLLQNFLPNFQLSQTFLLHFQDFFT